MKPYNLQSPDHLLSEYDLYLYHQGNLNHSYRMLGAHLIEVDGLTGVRFATWAPHAHRVSVVGNFNEWDAITHPMKHINKEGIWVTFIPGITSLAIYKYHIITQEGTSLIKADPYAFYAELRPLTASVVYPLDEYEWQDEDWQSAHKNKQVYQEPMNIYEVHLSSWKHTAEGSFYTYRELATQLVDYVVKMGYTHIEILPITEHPYDRSWGYQSTGYYAVTSRYGTPDDFKYLVDRCHQAGIAVILDWVPGHFCKDDHGLRQFDGMPLYEYEDSQKAEKRDWGTLSFDFGKTEVQSFLISNIIFWMEQFHIDGIRVDAVASMLYLDFGKKDGEWSPNVLGGRENLEAIAFLKKLNEAVFSHFPHALMMAEESTDFPLTTSPTYLGGLGFNYKWNMGWMNDMLRYMAIDPSNRKWHHQKITFSFLYAFSENFVLPLSHDEVVHGKRSLLNRMPGDYWQKFANLRVLLGYMITHPGKKLLFMGGEFGQFDEWKDLEDIDWELLDFDMHKKMHNYVQELNHFYLEETALWELDHEHQGFTWIDADNSDQSIIIFTRNSLADKERLIVLCNFTPTYYPEYRVGVPAKGTYKEVFNSDHQHYGGSGKRNAGKRQAKSIPLHKQPYHITISVPPLSIIILKHTIMNQIIENEDPFFKFSTPHHITIDN